MAIKTLEELITAFESQRLQGGIIGPTIRAINTVTGPDTSVNVLKVNPIADDSKRLTTGLALRLYKTNTDYTVNQYIQYGVVTADLRQPFFTNTAVYKVIRDFRSTNWESDQVNLQGLSYKEYQSKLSEFAPEPLPLILTTPSPTVWQGITPNVTTSFVRSIAQDAPWVNQQLPQEPPTLELDDIRANIYGLDSTLLVSSDQGYIRAESVQGTFSGVHQGNVIRDNGNLIINSATGAATITTGNITTVNATTGNITTVNSTTVNATTGNITTVNSNLVDATTVTADTLNSTSSYLGVVSSGIWNGSTLGVAYGGTGATTTQGVGGALDNLLPSGESSGFVLKTSGAGTYFWAAESGAGTVVGTRIDTRRVEYTATASQTLFTGVPTYTPGAGQLRVYISGVRQNPSAYTETSSTSFTLSTGVPVGTQVFAEVDGFVSYPIAASDISYSPIGGGSISGTTVQSAISEIDTEKAPLASPTFTGTVSGITATMVGLGNVTNESKATMFTNPTFTGTAILAAATINGLVTLSETTEVLDTKSSVTGTVVHDFSTSAIWYYSSISGAVTANFTNVPTTNNRVISLSIVVNQGVTGYLVNAVQIDGVLQTIRWQGNIVPVASTNRIDVFTFSLIRTGSAWTVLGAATSHG